MNPTRVAWLVVALLLPVALLNYLDRQMLASMKFSVMADIPTIATEANWGRMLGQFKWVYAFLSPVGGYLADRFGRRLTICGSLFVWSAVTWATGHVTSYDGLLLTRSLMGISEAFYIPAALALIADYHTRAHPLARGGAAPDGDLLRGDRGRLRRLRGGQPEPGLALGLRRLRRGRHGLRPAAGVPAARRAGERRRHDRRGQPPRSNRPGAPDQPLVHPAGALLHAAGAGGLGGARLDAGHPQAAVRHRPGRGRRLRDPLLAGRGDRRRARRGLAGRPLDAAPRARPHLRQRDRHEPHRPGDVRRGQRRHAGGGGGLPRPVRARLGLLRLQQHAHPLPDRAARRSGRPGTAS